MRHSGEYMPRDLPPSIDNTNTSNLSVRLSLSSHLQLSMCAFNYDTIAIRLIAARSTDYTNASEADDSSIRRNTFDIVAY